MKYFLRLAIGIGVGCFTALTAAIGVGFALPTRVIAFNSVLDAGPYKVFMMDTNARLIHSLSAFPAAAVCCLAWSPDGKTLAFLSYDDGATAHLYLIDSEGRHIRRLTAQDDQQTEGYPVWSPDGTRIAFTSFNQEEQEIVLADFQTGELRPLTQDKLFNRWQSWSPDGKTILFGANPNRDSYFKIFAVNADGSDLHQLTHAPGSDEEPEFSPDGARIVFASVQDGNSEIYMMNADGSNPVRLTHNPAIDSAPHWSPDGQHILFTSTREGTSEIFMMNADGSTQCPLTHTGLDDSWGALWSPDEGQIVFSSKVDGNTELYVMSANGSHQRRLTFNPATDIYPAWKPS